MLIQSISVPIDRKDKEERARQKTTTKIGNKIKWEPLTPRFFHAVPFSKQHCDCIHFQLLIFIYFILFFFWRRTITITITAATTKKTNSQCKLIFHMNENTFYRKLYRSNNDVSMADDGCAVTESRSFFFVSNKVVGRYNNSEEYSKRTKLERRNHRKRSSFYYCYILHTYIW